MKFTRGLIFLLNVLLGMVTLLSFLTPFINPKFYWVFSIIGVFFPVYMILHVLFLGFWLFIEWKKSIVSLLCLIFGFQHLQNYVGFRSQLPVVDKENTIEIASCNISYGYYLIEKDKVDKKENLLLVQEELEKLKEADIICFQEVGGYIFETIKKSFPKHKIYKTQKGVVILSRFPFGEKGIIDFGSITNSCIWADIKMAGETVRVYNFHLQSNKVSKDADDMVENFQTKDSKKWYQDIKGMLRKYRNTNISRAQQIDKIMEHVKNCPHPFLIGTDMNDVPVSYIYRRVSSYAKDSFSEKGEGLGTTYRGNIPLLRIDYLFYSDPFQCVQFQKTAMTATDHFAIRSTLKYHFEN